MMSQDYNEKLFHGNLEDGFYILKLESDWTNEDDNKYFGNVVVAQCKNNSFRGIEDFRISEVVAKVNIEEYL